MTTRDLLNEKDAARLIGMSASFLKMARLRGNVGGRTPGPVYYKIGGTIRYERADLDAWLSARRVDRSEHPATRRK